MKAETRRALLEHVEAGHDIESAAARAGVSMADVRRAGTKLKAEIDSAFRTGTAKLRARVMEMALGGQDAALLHKLLDRRDAMQADMGGGERIETIRRVIVPARCEACGQPATTATGADVQRGTLHSEGTRP